MLGNFYKRFFPTPYFLAAPSFGLDISDEAVKYLELIETKHGLRMGRSGERKIPPGVVELGEIKDTKKMEEILSLLKKEKGVKSVRVSLLEEQIYLYRLKLEKEGLESIRESIELTLEEHIPIPAPEAIFDYEILYEDKDSLYLQVAAIPQNIIQNYLSVFKGASISVRSFELEPQAISRAVIKSGDLGTYMIVDFGEKRTGIFIVSHGVVAFTSTLDLGGHILNQMIEKNFKVSAEEAEKIKKKYGLQRNPENQEIFSVLLNSVSILRDEIDKHFLYWHTHKSEEGKENPPIQKIILCGGDSNLIGLSEYLSVSLKTPVEVANVWVNVLDTQKFIPTVDFKQALSFAAALGLALGNFQND